MANKQSSDHITIAAIDIGTNSAHLVIADVDSHGHIKILDTHKTVIKLGAYIDPHKKILSKEGIAVTVEALRHMREIAIGYKPIFRTACTYAIRSVENHEEIFDTIYKETHLRVSPIDGLEEARLAILGIQFGLSLENETFLGVDIGGGSTEVAVCQKSKLSYVTSIQLGAVMLSQAFFDGKQIIRKKDITDLENRITLNMGPIKKELEKLKFEQAICCSGAAKALAAIHSLIFKGEELNDPHGYKLKANDVYSINKLIQDLRNPPQIQKKLKLDKNRSEIILAGSAIFTRLTQLLRIKEWTVSSFGLREGLLLDTLTRLKPHASRVPVKDIRWTSILKLGERFSVDTPQAKRVLHLALQIFDAIAPFHPEKEDPENVLLPNREILRAAAWLHECGKFISFPRYHHHSTYLIANSQLMGFSQKERLLIALVARYQRKGQASPRSAECQDLNERELDTVNFLASILRIACAAYRTRHGFNKDAVVLVRGRSITIQFFFPSHSTPEIEITKMTQEKTWLEEILGKKINLEFET
ncbi:MAG: Ppx/GppA family phosphatase [Deltaproteobacteria bacterium]|nr:Ppx/GppA family phosphatase [Deltaproteobacteria bacterium]